MNRSTLNRVIWRWHFWAGLIVSPILIIASTTGAIYIFKSELEYLIAPQVFSAKSSEHNVSLSEQITAATSFVGDDWKPQSININYLQPYSTNSVFFRRGDHEFKTVHVDASDGTVTGEAQRDGPLDIVLDIHRNLFIGTPGRIFMELTTGWTIVLLLTGLWLWWPKKWKKLRGVLIPRLDKTRYMALRDLHSISGAIMLPIAIIIAATGMLYTLVWGTTVLLAGVFSGAFDIEFAPPKSTLPEADATHAVSITVDDIMDMAVKRGMPMGRITIELPHDEEASFAIKSGGAFGPLATSAMFVDQYSGEVVEFKTLTELPVLAQYTQWNYVLHVGSVLGMVSKIIWLIVCLSLIAMPVTGIWMWLVRRSRGTSGFPKKYDQPVPKWIFYFIVLLGLFLPVVGISLLVICLVEWVSSWRKGRSVEAPVVPQ